MGTVRVMFSTTAGAGHLGPMVPVAHACRAAGHEVAVAAPVSFGPAVTDAGLPHLPFPDVPADQLGAVFARLPGLPREEANRVVISEVFGRLDARAALPVLLETVESWRPDVVVRDPCEFGALAAAAWYGLPQVQVAIGLGRLLQMAAGWLEDPIRELEAAAGLADLQGAARLLATPTLSSVPAVLDSPDAGHAGGEGPVWRFHAPSTADGPSLPGEWGDASAPLVYVSFGSVAGSLGPFAGMYPAILEVLADLPVRVLLTTGTGYDPARLGRVPGNARSVEWWPQAAAMREASVVIGHGGFGTTMIALAHGVPQLVLPLFASDQFMNAERVAEVGAGLRLEGGLESVGEVPGLVDKLLRESRFAATARDIAAEIAALPDVAATVDVLHDLVGRAG